MSNFRLNLPTDIPWKRICVTEDMVDRVVCDANLPPKWHSSLAVFKYVPEDEFQMYPNYKITYLKVTATITGYQPLDDEIQGEIDWDGLNTETREGITELLTSYHPCNGAILQVVVGPKGNNPRIPKEQYPFFMDFEPKKRELYELATDTKEKQSRSIETLNLTKSAGTTKSQEVMDIDMGGGGFGISGSYAGTGGGFNVQGSQGQWGTKQLNSQESMEMRSADSGQEKRESYSFTTHISQMYNQLNSYHIGTNRAVFFVQPRPHVIEQPTGFVRGPRAVEGIQEFFLIVAQPRSQEDFCVSLRLDTAHLTEEDILDYEYRTDVSEIASAQPSIPTRNDRRIANRYREACFGGCWDVTYYCHQSRDVDDKVYTAPNGFLITGISNLVNESFRGSTSATIAPGSKNLTVHAEATAERCFEGPEVCANCPDEWNIYTGYARRRVQVNLRSEVPTQKIGTRQVMLITTRGLCCCPETGTLKPNVLVTGVKRIPDYFEGTVFYENPRTEFTGIHAEVANEAGRMMATDMSAVSAIAKKKGKRKGEDEKKEDCGCGGKHTQTPTSPFERQIPIRKANEMIGFIRDEVLKSMVDPRSENAPKPFIQTDFFSKKMQTYVSSFRSGKDNLYRKVGKDLPKAICKKLEDKFEKKMDEINVFDLMTLRNYELEKLGKMKPGEVTRFKLSQLGIKFKQPDKPRGKPRRKK